MKTVIDEVNEFKGEIDTGCVAFVCNQSSGSINGWYGDTFVDLSTPQWTPPCLVNEFNDLVSQMETNFGECNQSYSDYKFDYHLSPEPALTYTQAMADNGVLPSVGMDCMVFVDENEKEVKEWFKGVVCGEYEGSPVIKLDDLTDGTEGYFDVFSRVDIKPLTPPIELIDGKAYQFESESVGDCGIYSDEDGLFHGTGNEKVRVKDCANIQLLTVEVK